MAEASSIEVAQLECRPSGAGVQRSRTPAESKHPYPKRTAEARFPGEVKAALNADPATQ